MAKRVLSEADFNFSWHEVFGNATVVHANSGAEALEQLATSVDDSCTALKVVLHGWIKGEAWKGEPWKRITTEKVMNVINKWQQQQGRQVTVSPELVDWFLLFFYWTFIDHSFPFDAIQKVLQIIGGEVRSQFDIDPEEDDVVKAFAEGMGITKEMAWEIDHHILPALDGHHDLTVAQVLDKIVQMLSDKNSNLSHLRLDLSGDESGQLYTCFRDFFKKISPCNLLTLSLVDVRLDKAGEDALFAALPCSRLEALELCFRLQSVESLFTALVSDKCNLQRLSLSTQDSSLLESLSSAIQHPACNLWDLTLNTDDSCDLSSLEQAFTKLRILSLPRSTVPQHSLLSWGTFGVLEQLQVTISEDEESEKHFATLIGQSKISHLSVWPIEKKLLNALTTHSQVTHLEIMGTLEDTEDLADFLADPNCKLEHLNCHECVDPTKVFEALESNYQSQLKSLSIIGWGDDRDRDRCDRIVKRNKLFLECRGDARISFERPAAAKLFICGNSGAGKTTIATNLKRKHKLPSFLQRHPTTQGIHVQSLQYGRDKLVICDVAGQREYHAFHHYFVRGSDKNLFLIVCRVSEDIEADLRYWLRFIASHKSTTKKPKVFIALNDFQDGKSYTVCQGMANGLAERYRDLLDISIVQEETDSGDSMCFKVVALDPRSLSTLKASMGEALATLLDRQPRIPSVCKKVQAAHKTSMCWWQCTKHQQPKVVSLEEVTMKLFPPPKDDNDRAAQTSATKFVMACMHDMGESLYFGLDFEGDELLKSMTILDTQWFVQRLVSIFIKVSRVGDSPLWRDPPNPQQPDLHMMKIAPKIEEICSPEHVPYALSALHKMGVILPSDEDWNKDQNRTWSTTSPKKVIVPAVLKNTFPGFEAGRSEYQYWGRRLECKDRVCTLLPAGIFTTAQVKLKTLCTNASYQIGDGWVFFEENDVQVVVRFGGDNEDWTDRHWVDVMVRAADDKRRCLEAEQFMVSIKDCIRGICMRCPSLELVEKVINPEFVKRRSERRDGARTEEAGIVVLLEEVYKMALDPSKGLTYKYTWAKDVSHEIAELLTPGELQTHVTERERSIFEEYEYNVASVYETPRMEPWEKFLLESTSLEASSLDVKDKLVIGLLQKIDQRTERIVAGLQDLKQIAKHTKERMKLYGEKILSNCSRMLEKLDVQCPRYPYLTEERNKLVKLVDPSSLVGKWVKLRYCCESRTGLHEVEANGIDAFLEHEWFSNHSHILVPAMKALFLAAKVTGSKFGVGESLVDAVRDNIYGAWMYAWKKPSEDEVEDIFDKVKQMARKEGKEVDDLYMRRTFGLHCRNNAWVCDKHA